MFQKVFHPKVNTRSAAKRFEPNLRDMIIPLEASWCPSPAKRYLPCKSFGFRLSIYRGENTVCVSAELRDGCMGHSQHGPDCERSTNLSQRKVIFTPQRGNYPCIGFWATEVLASLTDGSVRYGILMTTAASGLQSIFRRMLMLYERKNRGRSQK